MSKLELDEKIVRKLSELLQEMGLTEIEYESGGHRIRVARGTVASAAAPVPAPPAAAPARALLTDSRHGPSRRSWRSRLSSEIR